MKGIYLTSLLCLLFMTSCETISPEGEPPVPNRYNTSYPLLQLSTYLSDRYGNNLIPHPLDSIPYLDPWSFSATDEWGNDIGGIEISPSLGYMFTVSQPWEDVISEATYLDDSIWNIYLCFDEDCDTLTVRKTRMAILGQTPEREQRGCYFDWVCSDNDTIYDFHCRNLRLYP